MVFFREGLRHLKLLKLVTAKNYQTTDAWIATQYGFDEGLPKRTCSARNEYRFTVQHNSPPVFFGIL
jgi:hypothetical protein